MENYTAVYVVPLETTSVTLCPPHPLFELVNVQQGELLALFAEILVKTDL